MISGKNRFRMELNSINRMVAMLDSHNGPVFHGGDYLELIMIESIKRDVQGVVSSNSDRFWEIREYCRILEADPALFPMSRARVSLHFAAIYLADALMPEADAENWNASLTEQSYGFV